MKIKELIKILQQHPANMEVVIYDEFDHRYVSDEPYVFPDKQTKQYMIENGDQVPFKRLVLSMCGKVDDSD